VSYTLLGVRVRQAPLYFGHITVPFFPAPTRQL
jgi:hypothetical protein